MRAIVLLAAAAVAVTVARAQQPPEQERPTFRTGANMVRVDATVTDRHGNPVTSLSADDFVVFEDGVPQRIQSFKFVGATGRPAPGDEVSLAIRSPEHAAAEAARDDVRVFLIFWDDYHISPFMPTLVARRALQDFVLTALGPTDLVGLMDPLTPLDAIRFTRDRRALADAIHRLEGRGGIYVPPRNAAEQAQLSRPREIESIRSQVTVSALEGAAIHLGALREGRKSIVFVSETFGFLGADTGAVMRTLTDAANANNTAIYPFDPRGLGPRPSGLFRALADSTGAQPIVNTNSPGEALRQVVRHASAYYLLGYVSGQNPTDGRFHEIEVRLRRRDLEVQARRGYWAPSAADVERARTEAAAAAPPDITAALGTLSRPSKDRRLFDMWVGISRLGDGRANVTIAWSPRRGSAAPDEPARATLTATAADGRKYYEGMIPVRHVSFAAAPGPLRVQVAVLDADDAIVDRESREVHVPDYRVAALALSVPVVVLVSSPRDQRAVLGNPDAPPFAGREFGRTDRVLVRFAMYSTRAGGCTVTARLMSRRGIALATLPANRFGPGEDNYQVDLPLASVARGEYVIAIEARCGEDHAQALVPLRVVN